MLSGISQSLTTIGYALIGGIIPALIWLYFWTREDKEKPEPKRMILLAFLGGVFAVFISLYLEKLAYSKGISLLDSFKPLVDWLKNISTSRNISLSNLALVIVFAPIIEELAKFIMAYILVLRSRADDEPIDPIIYMITVALGFAAVENALFLIEPLSKNDYIFSVLTQNMRFIGATLLHTVSSAIIGFFMGFTLFENKYHKVFWTFTGIICAIIVHAIFNFFMMGSNESSFIALEIIWISVIVVLLAFERIKRRKLEKIKIK